MSPPPQARRWQIQGRVQGVAFRASTRNQALSLGCDGWVRNLPDGRVEVFAQGAVDALDALASWLQTGPALARVDGIVTAPAAPEVACKGFHVRR